MDLWRDVNASAPGACGATVVFWIWSKYLPAMHFVVVWEIPNAWNNMDFWRVWILLLKKRVEL